jgi:peptide/nickel transport system substrate-binding protein
MAKMISTAAAATVALFAGFAAAPASAEDKCARVITTDWNPELLNADPARLVTLSDVYHARMIFEPFIDADDAMQPVPVLAESWEVNADGTEWTFRVRQGVTFHDGSPLTAEDVVYSFQRILDPATASPAVAEIAGVKPENFHAVDRQTVKVIFDTPMVELPALLSSKHGMIVKQGATSDDIHFHPVGTGPFTVPEIKAGQIRTMFTRNANYWREGLPKSACIELRSVSEPTTRAITVLSGEADVVTVIDPSTVTTLKDNPNVTLTKAAGGSALTMSMFMDVPPFDDIRVRQAMKLVVDRQAMVDSALLGFGIPGNDNPILPSSPDAYRSDIIQRDVAKAKQLLAEAGYPDGISVDLHTTELYPGAMQMVQAYQEMAAEAGIKVNLLVGPAGEYWDVIWLKKPFAISTWGMRPTPIALAVAYRKDAAWNETHFFREDYDALLDKAAQTLDADARRKLYQEAQRMIAEEGGVIIPIFSSTIAATRKGCSGYTPAADHNRPNLLNIACEE